MELKENQKVKRGEIYLHDFLEAMKARYRMG